MPRIVSMLPAATEIVCALGAADELVGRSHECDFPQRVRGLPVVSRPALQLDDLAPGEIDRAVAERMRAGESLYVVDERLLERLAPDLVLTQDLCQVCAPSGTELTRALRSLSSRPEVLWLTPRTISEIEHNILAVGVAIGRVAESEALVARGRARLAAVRAAVADRPRRRIVFLEWTDPPYCAGHWVPEMIELAGGADPLGRGGQDSRRVTWDDVRDAAPELVIVAPCGYALGEAQRLATTLPPLGEARLVPVDANAFFARPGPRTIDGVELLAQLLHESTDRRARTVESSRIAPPV